ncbi:ankyrin repeat-containing domain protein [Tricharina praecox]|uniref:ankyrin repeat-containing domain protein n=1 Tax=Tricharina praecox TaxID=43433 RepID=UPI0022202F82|nr:ankyrin repeat-containing domain protein [Tricharina praecox]KAI5840142.1 ankyrin repeat-containing domain protein [Tricharina praecox]
MQDGYRDAFSSVCVFGLVRWFTTALESTIVEQACIDRLFLQASLVGDLEILQLLLDVGGDVFTVDEKGRGALALALQRGHNPIFRLLIDRGADVSAAAGDGWTPLHLASVYGNEEVARLLIDRGADVLAANSDGWTPLHMAATKGARQWPDC